MGRSGLLGYATLLLLLLAAVIVLSRSGPAAGMLAGVGLGDDADSAAVNTDLDPRVQPFRSPSTRTSTDQADRMIDDIEKMGEAYP